MNDLLTCLPALPVRTLLETLISLRARPGLGGKPVDLPVTSLHLSNGHVIKGWPLALMDENGNTVLLFQDIGPNPQRPLANLLYVRLERVEAVLIEDVSVVAPYLSEGRLEPRIEPAPGEIEIKRFAATCAQELEKLLKAPIAIEVDWGTIERSEPARQGLLELISELDWALKKIAEVDDYREEMSKTLHRVFLTQAPTPTVSFDEGTLNLKANFQMRSQGRLPYEKLFEVIKSAL